MHWHRVGGSCPHVTVLSAYLVYHFRGRAQPQAHLGWAVPQPHLDADHTDVSGCVPASGSDPNAEPRGGGCLLPGVAGVGIPTVGARLPAAMAARLLLATMAGLTMISPAWLILVLAYALD